MRRVFTIIVFLTFTILAIVIYIFQTQVPIITGYAAKMTCTCLFYADRNLESIKSQELGFSPVNLVNIAAVDNENKKVTVDLFGFVARTATYINGYGCILDPNQYQYSEASMNTQSDAVGDRDSFWQDNFLMDSIEPVFDPVKIKQILDWSFENNEEKQTRAVLVIKKGRIIGEKYSPGFDHNSKLLGWSMTKSITNALIGILVKNNLVDIHETPLMSDWKNTDKSTISLHDLLQMSSGLEWTESYGTKTDVTDMLYLTDDIFQFASQKNAEYDPQTIWEYSSGSTNIISGLIRKTLQDDDVYWSMPYDSLFQLIGMNSAMLELDNSGNFVASSYGWATTRDWAKFGLLFLNDGMWNGSRILPEGWVKYSTSLAPESPGIYGAHWWLNKDKSALPDVSDRVYSAQGFQGQRIFILPEQETIVVRLGLGDDDVFDFNYFLRELVDAIQ